VSTNYLRNIMDRPDPFYRLFKNKVENATIQLRSHDERNWPSFLYPPGTEYNINELDKNLFRGPILIRVCSFPFCAVRFTVKVSTDLANDLHREKFCIYQPSFCSQTFPSRNAWYARGFSRGRGLCCCSGEYSIAPLFFFHSTGFLQAYYGLCSMEAWGTEDRFFNLNTFFDKCIGLFTEDPNDPWVTDTLQFLTWYLHLFFFLFSSLFISSRQMPALTR